MGNLATRAPVLPPTFDPRIGTETSEQFNRLGVEWHNVPYLTQILVTEADRAERSNRVLSTSLRSASPNLLVRVDLVDKDTVTSGMNLWVDAVQTMIASLFRSVTEILPWAASKETEYEVEQDVYFPVPYTPSVERTLYVRDVPYARPHVILDFPLVDD